MYAIIRDSGKQYRVSEGDVIRVDLRQAAPGTELVFPEVLLYGDGEGAQVGRPTLPHIEVRGVVEREVKGPKIDVVKFRRRKDSRTHRGHRQRYLEVRITKIAVKEPASTQE